ncbi:MAG TPA: hypothetical protein VKP65_08620 [Rhodothermales bacterium]|nr:hypothetical protein [Rhodothermales bacterium]
MFAGASLPTGAYGSTTGEQAGHAELGIVAGIDLWIPVAPSFSPSLSWVLSLQGRTHSFGTALASDHISASGAAFDVGRDATGALLTGPGYRTTIGPGITVSVHGKAGLMMYKPPNLSAIFPSEIRTATGAFSQGFAYEAGASLGYDRFSVGLRYLGAQSVTADYDRLVNEVYEQPISMISLVARLSL